MEEINNTLELINIQLAGIEQSFDALVVMILLISVIKLLGWMIEQS